MFQRHLIWPALAAGTILFYSIPLFSPQASIHWDLADVSYPAQKYFADSVHAGKLPHWSPYLDSGIPFLAEPRTGAWYPLHWPFFALGITPRAMEWELALHAILGLWGTFLLARRLFGQPGPAVLGAVLYAWGGYFAAHSADLPLFEIAALLPWLLWTALGAIEAASARRAIRWIAGAGLTFGFILLAGHIASAFECLLAAALFIGVVRASGTRKIAVFSSTAVGGLLLSGVLSLPALELSRLSGQPDASMQALAPGTLATLISPDYYTLMSGLYSGPGDLRENYLYSGLMLLPLAAAGLVRRQKLLILAALVVPALWFAFGKPLWLYTLLSGGPGLRGSAPADIWFVAGLGLALAAVSGTAWIAERIERPWLWIALLVLTVADLWFWNIRKNPMVYANISYSSLYSKPLNQLEKAWEKTTTQPLYRIWSPYPPLAGPADEPLISRTEVGYGSGLAELDRYSGYNRAILSNNYKLLNGLGITAVLGPRDQIIPNPASLGRVSSPPHVDFVADRKAAAAGLAKLDPAETALVEGSPQAIGPATGIEILDYRGDYYRIRYNALQAALLRVAVPYYPGWSATVDGQAAHIAPVDEALTGIFVPSGQHEVTLQHHPRWFKLGAILSGSGALLILLGLILPTLFAGKPLDLPANLADRS